LTVLGLSEGESHTGHWTKHNASFAKKMKVA